MEKEKIKNKCHDHECDCKEKDLEKNIDDCEEEDICCDDCNCEESKNEECNCENNETDCDNESKEIDKLNEAYNKISELEDALLRTKADFINYRKRLEEEQSRMLKYCNEDIVKEILPVIDNFERAIGLDDNNLEDELSKFLSGFKMIYCNLVSSLKKFDVIEIDGNNKPFDATYHQAVMTDKTDDIKPGYVIEVLQKGYILKGKVIRPAMVKVSE